MSKTDINKSNISQNDKNEDNTAKSESKKIILTFARQFGSGGHEIAKKTAEILGIPFYDKELIAIAAKESGMSEHLFEGLEEKPTNSLLYSLVMGLQTGSGAYCRYGDAAGSDNIFRIQSNVIRSLAEQGSCVIVGRCSDYVLRDEPNMVSVFIHAGEDFRTERIMHNFNLKEKAALDSIHKTDKRRSSFYNFYTNKVWGCADNYDLSINTEKLGIDGAARLIIEYVNNIR